MSDLYSQLLEATIRHLEDLKHRGTRFVSFAPEPPASALAAQPAAVAGPLPETVVVEVPAAPPSIAAAAAATAEAVSGSAASPAVPGNKAAALAALHDVVRPCVKCAPLAAARRNVVFGVGNPEAELMFVGEAPGSDEDRAGEPFVGAAGQLLTKIIQAMGLSRTQVYIANILKCRPDTPGQSSGNRKPTPEEMRTCIPYLHQQIEIIQPKVMVALGATAIEGLLGKTEGITRLRGRWQAYRGIPLMPTYHPAYLLRNQSLQEKRRVWEDMLQVMERLGRPISEKQARYFT